MRIIQINAVYGTMSTGRSARELSDWLVARGHDCFTYYTHGPKSQPRALRTGSVLSHKVHAVTARLTGNAGIGSWCDTRRLLRQIKSGRRPDLICLWNVHSNGVHVPELLRFLAREDIPTVAMLHDCFFFTGGCMHYTANGCTEWQRACEGCCHLKFGHDWWLRNNAAANLRQKKELFSAIPRLAVVGVSDWTASEALLSPVFSHARIIRRIYNWIDSGTFHPMGAASDREVRERFGVKGAGHMLLGVASGWGHGKGIEDFLALSPLLDEADRIVLVGSMPADVPLPANIIAPGPTANATELARIYSAADVFVHLSLEETFGKVTAEALSCGTPAVVCDSTASPELVSPDTGAVIRKFHDPEATFRAVQEALAPGKAVSAPRCTARAAALFDKETLCRETLALYEELAAM